MNSFYVNLQAELAEAKEEQDKEEASIHID